MDISILEQELTSLLELSTSNCKVDSQTKFNFHCWVAKFSEYILSSKDLSLLRKYPLLCPAIVSFLIDSNNKPKQDKVCDSGFLLAILSSARICPIVCTVVLQYLSQYTIKLPPRTTDNSTIIQILDILIQLLTEEPNMFSIINLASFLSLIYHKDKKISWRAYKLFSKLFQIDLEFIVKFHFNDDIKMVLSEIYETNNDSEQTEICQAHIDFLKELVAIFPHWANINGILLAKTPTSHSYYSSPMSLIKVPTTKAAIQSIAFSVAQRRPVLIRGEIGVGKTMLVSHLANLLGKSQDLVTIQLSDQTDSKSLIGSYTSTDNPGEFVWKPGALVHAMQTGKWLLLEDIDYAGKDVISTLLPILENNVLPIPGMSENVTAGIGFQIFATQRTNTNFQPLFSSEAILLEKYWSILNVYCPSFEELEVIISQKFPNLSSTASQLIHIFQTIAIENTQIKFQTEILKRKVTLRDLMKWCKRIENFVNGLEIINIEGIFLEALDCFVVTFLSKLIQHSLATQLGNLLVLNQTKIDYYLTNYKPRISFSVANCCIGRAIIPLQQSTILIDAPIKTTPFAYTQQTSVLLERLAVCVQYREPVLLVGETGTGKTSAIQHLAMQTNNKLVVINMSRHSDTIDLLGGYKPVDLDYIILPLKCMFLNCFEKTFSKSKNGVFIGHIETTYKKKDWETLIAMMEVVREAANKKDTLSEENTENWSKFTQELAKARINLHELKNTFAFRFVEGALVKAIKNGWWVLLDEINLACPEVLECLNGMLDQSTDSVLLTDTYTNVPIKKNENFHIFACMNPALDIGKKRLPQGIENRFTEIFVHELTQTQDLRILVSDYLQAMSPSVEIVNNIVEFYIQVLNLATEKLVDGSGHKPHFSLRSLCRALRYTATNPCCNITHSIYEGICMSFLTQLNQESYNIVETLAQRLILKNATSLLKQKIPRPKNCHTYTNILGYWIQKGNLEVQSCKGYVITPAISRNLKDIARITSARQYPILLQGPTSSGKTSLIQWLATNTGNKIYRINNHEHTDLQEYIGSYIPDENGKLAFKEGLLPRAMRNGDWIILDELNLAPSDVLEALNRVLDDNRELFITETQTTIKAHPNFILFATQNPPGLYGGRKLLSRAFRNRFIELHFIEIPTDELIHILHQKCAIPKSYSRKMVGVMRELQSQRKLTGVFAGKHGYITLRDLFKWAERYRRTEAPSGFRDWDQLLIEDGYLLLAGRLRHCEEIAIVVHVLEKHFKRQIDQEKLFNTHLPNTINNLTEFSTPLLSGEITGMEHIYLTKSFRRLLIHVARAVEFDEPILLVGPTGSGKTTVCQLISILHRKKLQYINCHMHTETADFIGSLRPVRTQDALDNGRLFEWMDGPLVQAVKNGQYMLLDEISLADDAVLERLNSLLEPERSLVIAEKGGMEFGETVEITADKDFKFFGTMNPGGDFGKKELSPALRNRFTEIWCPESDTKEDTISLLTHNLKLEAVLGQEICSKIVTFVEWFQCQPNSSNFPLSKRDLLCWVEFINRSNQNGDRDPTISPWDSFIEGAHLVLLDGLGVGLSTVLDASSENESIEYLQSLLPIHINYKPGGQGNDCYNDNEWIWSSPFKIEVGLNPFIEDTAYSLTTPTVSKNVYRILRALQIPKPILLEGIPGVGKSSIVIALALYSGHELVRINLSEQTDISDLFGADLPSDSENAGEFVWRDGPLLRALKKGSWILLDELNLASQSVLEGLNSCFDHRREIYISELDKTFQIRVDSTRVFATQNPMRQGGGRKGLPKSFLNRFTKVYMHTLEASDLIDICRNAFSEIDYQTLNLMVEFNQLIDRLVNQEKILGHFGSPFEFNLRDVFRWCHLMITEIDGNFPFLNDPGRFIRLIYSDRMRTIPDKDNIFALFTDYFHEIPEISQTNKYIYDVISTQNSVQIGQVTLPRNPEHFMVGNEKDICILPYQLPYLESIMYCVKNSWLPIIIGSVGVGKSSLVRLLAKLTGNTLHEFSVNSAMDSYELVGGFHQVGNSRKIKICLENLQNLLGASIKTLLVCDDNHRFLKKIYTLYHLITSYVCYSDNDLPNLIEKILRKTDVLSKFSSSPLHFLKISLINNILFELQSILHEIKSDTKYTNKFVWIDSPLVLAAKNGHWLLIDNVNLCSPSVLDRLNALLEPKGTLTIHEKGIVDDICEEITPHKDFRLFFCMDQKLGELSRAMRNRGIEICISKVSAFQDSSTSDIDLKYGLLELKFEEKRRQLAKLLGINNLSDNSNQQTEILQYYKNIQHIKINGNHWRSANFLTKNPIISNVLSECEILLHLPMVNDKNFQKHIIHLFMFLSTQCDLEYRKTILNQYTHSFYKQIIDFIWTNNLHEISTEKFRITHLDTQHLPLDLSYRENLFQSINQNKRIRVMNEIEKIKLRVNIHSLELFINNFDGTINSLYTQSKHPKMVTPMTSENIEIQSTIYLYPLVTDLLKTLSDETFWSTHHHSNWDAVNQSVIWLQNFIEYILVSVKGSKEDLTIVWYLFRKNFILFLGKTGINWEQLNDVFSQMTEIEQDLNTSILDSPLVQILDSYPKHLPLNSKEILDCATGLQTLLEVLEHMPTVPCDIIHEISQLRSILYCCSLDISMSTSSEPRNVPQSILELNKRIRLPFEKMLIENPLHRAKLAFFYNTVLYISSIRHDSKFEDKIIKNSLFELRKHAIGSNTVTNIHIMSLLSPIICTETHNLRENQLYFQELYIQSVTLHIQLLMSQDTPNNGIFSFLSHLVDNLGNNSKSITEQENKIGIKLQNFDEKNEELRDVINHFACISFTQFISNPNNSENIFSLALFDTLKAFNVILQQKDRINLFLINNRERLLSAGKKMLIQVSNSLIDEQINRETCQAIIANFKECITNFEKWIQTNSEIHQYNYIVFLGITMVYFLSPNTPLDPVVINQKELQCLEKELKNLESNLSVHRIYYRVCFGITEVGLREQTTYPLERLERRISCITNEIDKLKKRLAVRPSISEYSEIYYMCRKASETICNAENIRGIIERLDSQTQSSAKDINSLFTLTKSIANTIYNLQRRYLAYPDVIIPFTFSLSIVLYGLYNKMRLHQIHHGSPIQHIQKKLTSFSGDNLINTDQISSIIDSELFPNLPQNFREKICKLMLLWILEAVDFNPNSHKHLDVLLYTIFDLYSREWDKYLEREKQKQIEKDSLYKYKEEQHCMDSSEELIAKDFQVKFPDYYDNFRDISDTDSVITERKGFERKSTKPSVESDENTWSFNEDTYTFLANIHSYFHSGYFLLQTQLFNHQSRNMDNFLNQRILHQYHLAHSLSIKYNEELLELPSVLILVSDICLKSITQNSSTEIYDFYRDPNPRELHQVKQVLTTFKNRISNLLEEWPEHSVLNQLIIIADRILSFPITSPVMQVLTGLQILNTRSQDWEACAAKHVSIQEELGHISRLIIRYRKMELEGWPKLLEASHRRFQMKSTKYFMHLYQNICPYFIIEKVENPGDIDKLSNLLKQFIESSALGDFAIKLKMMGNFKFSFKFSNTAFHTLTGLHSFYCQFLPDIEKRFETLCSPIVKELKEFVSISKWNDISYWRLKDSVEKSHKTIHKHIRKYEEVLNQPIYDLLIINTFNLQKFSDLPHIDWLKEMKLKLLTNLREKSPGDISYILKECESNGMSLPLKTDKISAKFMKYILRIMESDKQLDHIHELRNLTSQIRENMNEIISETKESLTPDNKAEMKNQKFLCIKKQRQLSELFKILRTFGFSNRFASTGGKTLLDTIDFSSIHTLLPFPKQLTSYSVALQYIDPILFENLKLVASLDMSLRKPHTQLTPYLVESLRAYSIQMMHAIISHRQQTLHFAQSLTSIRDYLVHSQAYINSVYEPKSLLALPPNNQVKNFVSQLSNVLNSLLEQLKECSAILTGISIEASNSFPLDKTLLPKIISDSDVLENVKGLLKNTSIDAKGLFNEFLKLQNCFLFQWSDVDDLKNLYNNLARLFQCLSHELTNALTTESTQEIEYGFFRSLFRIQTNFEQSSQRFEKFLQQVQNISINQSLAESATKNVHYTSNIFQIILTSVQTLISNNKSNQDTSSVDLELMDTSRNTDHYLKNLLLNNEEIDLCKLEKLLHLITNTLTNLKLNSDEQWTDPCRTSSFQVETLAFLQLQSLLDSYVSMCESIFLKNVEIQYNTNELLQIVLSIFNLVSAKGFCTPEAVLEEMAKEGDSVLQEFEGGGFGDGEGTTNVSEQIDNQEQVEGLQNDEPTNGNKEEILEEKGIEMNEEFDGGMGDKANGEDDGDNNSSISDDLDKRMGEVDQEQGQMDEEMWGESSEDEEELKGNEEAGIQSKEERLTAKGESVKNNKHQQNEQDNKDSEIDQLQDELDDNLENQIPNECVDNEQPQQPPDQLDLPDDINLDGIERENSVEQSIEGSEHESQSDMDTDDIATQELLDTMDNETDKDSDFKTMDKLEGNESNSESEQETNQSEIQTFDTTDHTGDPQTAVQSSSKYGTGTDGDMDKNIQNEDIFDKVGNLQNQELTETEDGITGNITEKDSNTQNENKIKSKLSRSNENRQLADEREKPQLKKQKVINEQNTKHNNNQDTKQDSELYQHKTTDSDPTHYDSIVLDSATSEQAKMQHPITNSEKDDIELDSTEDTPDNLESMRVQLDPDADLHMDTRITSEDKITTQEYDDIIDENIPLETLDGSPNNQELQTFFATNQEYLHTDTQTLQTDFPMLDIEIPQQIQIAAETQRLWSVTESDVSHLSRDLCEQLRLILQPQQASKLKGDYRTGKRLNMRKIIPYIASQYRNDKIWLRRTQPNKRQYQIMLAMDDSKSMANYKSKTIAFQTLALLGNALTWLDVGQLGVCKFGETTDVLIPLGTPFTQETAFQALQQLNMEQKKTKIAQMLRRITPLMMQNRTHMQSPFSGSINQLLVIISDGRGIFLEGKDLVEKSVRQTMENGIFVIFIILDNPDNRDSIIDIKVPIFSQQTDTLPEFKSYLEMFPFPFYIVLRDIQSLPETVSNALRQWFEFVCSTEF